MRQRLLLTTDAVGGVWTYSLDLARALAGAEDMVVLLAVLGPPPSNEQMSDAAAVPGLQLVGTSLPLDWTAGSDEEVLAAATALAALAREAGADLVQLHSPALALADYPAPVVSVVHSCVGTWWDAVKSGPLPDDLAWRSAMVARGLAASALVVAPTRAFAAAVQETYALPSLPQAVHNGRHQLAGPAAIPVDYALTAGRLWDSGKNVAAFDRAAALSRIPFRAAGPLHGPTDSAVRLSYAEALGPLSSEQLASLLAERPVFVSAALYEPFGLAVLEAAQCGCALVLADRPGFRELWDGAALFVDPLDEHAIAAAVERLVARPELRGELGDAARARAAHFSPHAMGSAMLDLYDGLVERQKVAA
ncbi:glycosyltransferase family 4 protein [Sphingomonas swuensis]|uniref:Glycosyltransferase family 4 protein n=1 Tax=Sphingomonas swuensis TaxID=977800 RepID=A0ABP7SH40_9SPHN